MNVIVFFCANVGKFLLLDTFSENIVKFKLAENIVRFRFCYGGLVFSFSNKGEKQSKLLINFCS